MSAATGPRPRLPGALRVVRAVLRSPAPRRVMLAFFLFNAAEFATWVAVLLYAYEATGPASVGVVGLVQLLPAAVFAAAAAAAADRYPRERVLLAGYVLQALAMAVTAAGMAAGAPTLAVYAAAAATACVLTITRPAQGALLPSLARTPEELTASNALAGSVEGAGVLLGPLTAAAILVVAPPAAVFVAGAVAAGAAALLVGRLPLPVIADAWPPLAHAGPGATAVAPSPGDALEDESPGRRIIRGLGALGANPDAGVVVAILSARMVVIGAMDVLAVLLALDVLGTGDPGAGVLTAAVGLGTIAGGAATFALVGRRRLVPVITAGAIGVGASLLILSGTGSAWVAAALFATVGMGCAVIDVAGRTMLQRVARDRVLARLLGALEGMGMAGLAAGSILVSGAGGLAGVQVAVILTGLAVPVTVALAWIRLRAIEARADVPFREIALLRLNRILSPLPAPQLEAVACQSRWLTFEAGETLMREGEAGDRYHVLATGSIRITQGGGYLRDLVTAGDGLGEIALLWDVPRTATATASAPTVVLALDRADFIEAVTGHEQARATGIRVAEERSSARPRPDPGRPVAR